MTDQTIAWLRDLAAKGGKGVVNNIDARCLGRIADELERLTSVAQAPVNSDLLATYRDIFAEITAKAAPVCDPTSDDPERVRYYRIPVRPLHRAAGKLNFQMFDGETHLASAIQKIAQVRDATIEECAQVCEGGDWTRHATHHSPTKSCAIAIRALMGSVVSSTSHVTGLVPDPNSASGYKLTSTDRGTGA